MVDLSEVEKKFISMYELLEQNELSIDGAKEIYERIVSKPPQPYKEPESQREELTMIADVLQIAREDLQYKIAHNITLDLFKDFQLLNEVRSDVLLIRDRFEGLSYSTFTPDGRLKVSDFIDTKLFMELKTKSTPTTTTSAKSDKEIEELAEVYAKQQYDENIDSCWPNDYNGFVAGYKAAMLEIYKAKP
jgi:uncharacterized protein YqfB (UPF0267 family)